MYHFLTTFFRASLLLYFCMWLPPDWNRTP
jgi:hypothetical protein